MLGDAERYESRWSEEIRVMFRPRRTYQRLARSAKAKPALWLAVRRPLRFLFIIGGFVALSSAGRLYLPHIWWTMFFWSFLPVLQIAGLLLSHRLVAPRTCRAVAIDLYFAGQGPWLLLFVLLAGLCLFAPSVYAAFLALLRTGVLPGAILATIGWSTILTWLFFRHGLGLGKVRSLAGLSVLYGVYGGAMIGYFAAANQIQPLLAGGG